MNPPDEDADDRDDVRTPGLESRSAAQQTTPHGRASELGVAYEDAWTEWANSGEDVLWDVATADGPG